MEEIITQAHFRKAFTMVELILVIVIVGIIASIALTRLFAVRDDAKISTDIASMSACISDAGMYYTARGLDMPSGASDNCDAVKCFTITYASSSTDFAVVTNPNGADYCERVDELGGHLARTYHFHGSRISL